MKRVIGLVFIFGTASCVAASAAPTQHAGAAHPSSAKMLASRQAEIMMLAPADEYFGPLKMSILGIRNTIHDLGARYDVNPAIGDQTYKSAQLTERAIHDWEKRYPHDGQVPKAIYLIQRLYTKVLTQASRDRAVYVEKWMFADYAKSPQGKQLKKTVAAEHLAPIPAPTPAATPTPAFSSDFGPNYKSDFSNAPAPSTSAQPATAPTASPLP